MHLLGVFNAQAEIGRHTWDMLGKAVVLESGLLVAGRFEEGLVDGIQVRGGQLFQL